MSAAAPRTFTAADARATEARYGFAYFVSRDGRSLLPATHVGPDRIATITRHPGPMREWVAWRVVDGNGALVLHSTEDIIRRPRMSYRAAWLWALRRAVLAVHGAGATARVRPGDRGPWGAGAGSIDVPKEDRHA